MTMFPDMVDFIHRVQAKMQEMALAEGMSVRMTHATYNASGGKMALTFGKVESIGSAAVVKDSAWMAYTRNLKKHGLDRDLLGAPLRHKTKGDQYIITGYRPRARKAQIRVNVLKAGETDWQSYVYPQRVVHDYLEAGIWVRQNAEASRAPTRARPRISI